MTQLPDRADASMDVIAGGGGPRRRLPRWLVVGLEVVLGAVALVWVGLQVAHHIDEPTSSTANVLTLIGTSDPSYQPGHGQLEIKLQNNSGSTVYIDNLTALTVGATPSDIWAPSWIRTQVIDPPGPAPVLEGPGPPLDVEVNGFGGVATLRVSIDPPCGESPPASAAEIVVGYHDASGALGQLAVPEVLNTGSTVLPVMVTAACQASSDPDFHPPPIGRLQADKRYTLTVGGTPVSFGVPGSGWWNEQDIYFGKSTSGGPSAETIFFLAAPQGVPDGVRPCGQWWGNPTGDLVHYATSAGRLPWTGLAPGKQPAATRVGGQQAATAVLRVEGEGTCQPGFLYTWPDNGVDGMWSGARRGDTIRLWIVDVDGSFLVVEAISHPGSGLAVRHEIQQVVASIRFG